VQSAAQDTGPPAPLPTAGRRLAVMDRTTALGKGGVDPIARHGSVANDRLAGRTLVPILAGGGTRLPAHVGILQGLQDLGVQYNHVVGISGGSIVAALLAAGRSIGDLRDLALGVDFNQFRGMSLVRLVCEGGLSSGDRFERWVDEQVRGATFADLHRDLHVVAADVRSGAPVVFDRSRTPTLRVARAVRFSMGIPLLFTFQEHDGYLLVDGSILAEEALHRDWSGDGTPVVCFRLRSSGQQSRYVSRHWLPIAQYMGLLLRTFMNTLSREYISEALWYRTVVVETGDLSPVEFKMTREEKQGLYEAGYRTTVQFLPMKLARQAER